MHVFVTGASGWVGSAVVPELLAHGHTVVGLARSDASAAALEAAGAQVVRGDLDDLDLLRETAAGVDGVIHLAFKHDLAFGGDMIGAADADLAGIRAFGDALAGTDKPLLIASGLAGLTPGRLATEQDVADTGHPMGARAANAQATVALADRGVRSVVVRLAPTTHGEGDNGFLTMIVANAREKGTAAYVGDGANCWCAVNRADAAVAFRLALESAPAGSTLHAVGEEGVPMRAVAEEIGRQLGLPVTSVSAADAPAQLGWLGPLMGSDIAASSAYTQELLGWTPTHPGLLADLRAGYYTA